jgi:hypothetical protein
VAALDEQAAVSHYVKEAVAAYFMTVVRKYHLQFPRPQSWHIFPDEFDFADDGRIVDFLGECGLALLPEPLPREAEQSAKSF